MNLLEEDISRLTNYFQNFIIAVTLILNTLGIVALQIVLVENLEDV